MPMGTYRLVVSFYLVVCFETCARQDTSNIATISTSIRQARMVGKLEVWNAVIGQFWNGFENLA